MLFVIDMQNEYVNIKSGNKYVKGSENLVQGIIKKIKEYEDKGEHIFYTSDISVTEIEYIANGEADLHPSNDEETIKIVDKKANNREKWNIEPYHALQPFLSKHMEIKKSYYALPPETLLQIQKIFKKQVLEEEIEFVGVETHICVLANAICIQSAFPDARIIINSSLCKSSNLEDHNLGLKTMKSLGMEVRR